MFVGRRREEKLVRDLVDGIGAHGGAQLVVGDPGIGKSTLIGLARRHAVRGGVRVLAATGVPAESGLPYAGLHQLLLPLRDGVGALPEPQRAALTAAFEGNEGAARDRFLVSLAVTELLSAAAAQGPLLVVADDAHRLDAPSCEVLAQVARRIGHEPIVVLVALRDGYELPLLDAGLPELRLTGLDERSSGEVVDAFAPGLPHPVRQEVLAVAMGNPLALCELAISAARRATARTAPFRGPLPVSSRIEGAFAARWSELPDLTRTVLLVAALNDGGTEAETLSAATVLTGTTTGGPALVPAVAARLVELGQGGLRFRHPLVRSAIEQRADRAAVAAAHRALAEVLADRPDRRAWHRAGAADGPDESIAADLDAAADRAARQAAPAVAVAALERAAELSPLPAARDRRLLRAAHLSAELGRPALVERFLRDVDTAGLGVVDQARLALLREALEDRPQDQGTDERVRRLVGSARRAAAAGEAALGMELLLSAARRCWWGDQDREIRLLVATAALELSGERREAGARSAPAPVAHNAARSSPDPVEQPALLVVLAFAAPDVHRQLIVDGLGALSDEPAALDAGQLAHLGTAGALVGEFERARALFAAAVPRLRSEQRRHVLVRALHHDAYCALHTGDWSGALSAATEAGRLAAETGQERWAALAKIPQALVAALRGDADATEELAAAAEQVLAPSGTAEGPAYLRLARGISALGAGRYEDGHRHLRGLFDPADSPRRALVRDHALADYAEAAAHSGNRQEAREVLARLEAAASPDGGTDGSADGGPGGSGATGGRGRPAGLNLVLAKALLSEDEDAGTHFEQALTDELRGRPWQHARLELAYGGWLRRHRRAADSRGHLHTAREIFRTLGAAAWLERADQELRASGVRQDRAAAGSADRRQELTPQERQIAALVLDGLSNRRIGEQLHLSHRTVSTHLYRMFPKLGITSRAELHAVLAGPSAPQQRAGRPVPRQLPPDPRYFAGREAELAQAMALLDGPGTGKGTGGGSVPGVGADARTGPGAPSGEAPRHVVIGALRGMAGVGKTTLAVRWAHHVADRYPDGQLYVNLQGFSPAGDVVDPGDVLVAFLAALGVEPRQVPAAPAERAALFRARTAGLRLLVLLDNARDAEQVRPLLTGAPSCLTIVTSRNQLSGLAVTEGAASLALGPWSTAQAVRALAGRIGRGRVEHEPEEAAELVALCGHLPLAVAVVAARLQANEALPLAAALDELRDGTGSLDAFADQDRAADLRAVFSWSYEALGDEAARLFRVLSLHPGPDVSAEAAASLSAVHPSTARTLLRELTGAHLANATPDGRYTLHDLLRAYAGELTRTHDAVHAREAAFHRMVQHYRHTLISADRQLGGEGALLKLVVPLLPGAHVTDLATWSRARAWTSSELPVLFSVHRAAVSAGFHREARLMMNALKSHSSGDGGGNEAVRRAEQAAALAAGTHPSRERHAVLYGELPPAERGAARRTLERVLEEQAHGSPADRARLHFGLFCLSYKQDDFAAALGHARESERLHRQQDNPGAANDAQVHVGDCLVRLGRPEEGLRVLQEALAAKDPGARVEHAVLGMEIGYAQSQCGRHEDAIDAYRAVLGIYRDELSAHGTEAMELRTLHQLSRAQRLAGRVAEAQRTEREAQELQARIGSAGAGQVQAVLESLPDDAGPGAGPVADRPEAPEAL